MKGFRWKENIVRYLFYLLGIFIMAWGVNILIASQIGNSPLSCVPYTLHVSFPQITLGTFSFLLNMVFILGQILLLRKDFEWIQLIQIPQSFIFAFFIDITRKACCYIQCTNYFQSLCLLVTGIAVLSLGVSVSVNSKITMNASEAVVAAASRMTGRNFGYLKVLLDCMLVIASIALGMILIHKIAAVREGTVITAVTCGLVVKFMNKYLKVIDDFCGGLSR